MSIRLGADVDNDEHFSPTLRFGRILRDLRRARGLTVRGLAAELEREKLLERSHSTFVAYENGRLPSEQTIMALEEFYVLRRGLLLLERERVIRDGAKLDAEVVPPRGARPGEAALTTPRPMFGELPPGVAHLRFGLPQDTRLFTGREDELELLDGGWPTGARVAIQVITGLGGVGKSRLAAHYAHERTGDYDVIAWIRAEDGGTADLAAFAEYLGEPVANLSFERRADVARRWLEHCQLRWLLVLDDVPSARQLANCVPQARAGRVLVTMRDRAGIAELADDEVELGVFDEPAAVAYLLRHADRSASERDDALLVARRLGCLPLALSHAAAYRKTTTFAQYLRLVDELPSQTIAPVAMTWRVSIDAAAQRAPLALDVLTMTAHLGSRAIPRTLLAVLIDPAEPLSQWRVGDALKALSDLSLVDVNDATISVHPLLQDVVRDGALPGVRDGADRALRTLAAAFPNDPSVPGSWPECELLLPHVVAIADKLGRSGDHAVGLLNLLHRGWSYLLQAGQRERAISFARQNTRVAAVLLGTDHPETLTAQIREATSLQWWGKTKESVRLSSDVLTRCRAQRGDELSVAPQARVTLRARAQLAFSHQWARRLGPAIELGEQVLREHESILGVDHSDTLTERVRLSWSYYLAGRYDDAIATIQDARRAHCEALDDEHPTVLFDRASLAVFARERAVLHSEIGRVRESVERFALLAEDRARLLGHEHPDTLWSRVNLARSHELCGDAAAALEDPAWRKLVVGGRGDVRARHGRPAPRHVVGAHPPRKRLPQREPPRQGRRAR